MDQWTGRQMDDIHVHVFTFGDVAAINAASIYSSLSNNYIPIYKITNHYKQSKLTLSNFSQQWRINSASFSSSGS